MRERRAAGDPYWSYSGEPPFMLGNGLRALSRSGNMCEIQILVVNKTETAAIRATANTDR